MIKRILAIAVALSLGACAAGPDYAEPETGAADFRNAENGRFERARIEAAWWQEFGDPVLDELIERALTEDLDLRIAAARVREARALFRDHALDRFPEVTAGATYDRRKAQQPGFSDARVQTETWDAGFDAFWEIDLFGAVRRRVEAARADAEAAEAGFRAAQVSVAAEVARNYLLLRGAQRRYRVALANLETQRETVRLTEVRYEHGRGTELDVASATAELKATEAAIPPLVAAEKAALHRLAVLLGQRPAELEIPAEPDREGVAFATPLPIGDPAELLRRRPDIRAAERSLAAATARTGVVAADLFPRLSVSGFVGFVTGDASELGESASRAWSVTPVLSWAAFDLGSVRARLRAVEAQADQALAFYELAVLRALEETENAFVGFAQNQSRLAALAEQARASSRAAALARIRYREGAIDFLRLLDAERTVLEAEDAVALAETELNTSVVAIYKALGGGWEVAPGFASFAPQASAATQEQQ